MRLVKYIDYEVEAEDMDAAIDLAINMDVGEDWTTMVYEKFEVEEME